MPQSLDPRLVPLRDALDELGRSRLEASRDALARAPEDCPLRAALALSIDAFEAIIHGRYRSGVQALLQALPTLELSALAPLLGGLHTALAHALGLEGDPIRGLEVVARAMTLTESDPQGAVRRKALSTRGMLLAMLGDHAAALTSLQAVRDLGLQDGDARAQAIAWGNLAYCHLDEAWNLPAEAPRRAVLAAQGLPDADEAARLAIEAGLPLYQGFAGITAGGCLAMLGRLDESTERLDLALALTRGMPSMEADAHLLRAWVWRMQGAPVEATDRLDRAEALCQDGHLPLTLGRVLDERLHLAQTYGDTPTQLATALKALHHWKHIDAARRHTVARHAALFAEAERARSEAQAWALAARQDPLTGTLNRRGLDDARDGLEGRAVQLIALDVDHFKRINDQLGHAVGDAVLVQLAALLRVQFRRQDLIARMGGEEFLVVLPETTRGLSRQRAEHLRQRVETADWSAHHPDLRVTISLGLSSCPADGNFDEALAAADGALYRAKAAGRNCFAEAAD